MPNGPTNEGKAEKSGEDPKILMMSDTVRELRSQSERLSAENLVLKQHLEFAELFRLNEKAQATLFEAHKKHIDAEINKRLVAMSIVGLLALGVAWYQTITPIRERVQSRLDKEFASDNIHALISDAAQKAAQSQTARLMDETIRPATSQALADIQSHRDEVSKIADQLKRDTSKMVGQMHAEVSDQSHQETAALNALQKEYTKELGDLRSVVAYQDKLKDIQLLKGEAISGDFVSLTKLLNYPSTDPSLKGAADAAVLETKMMSGGDRVRGVSIWMKNADGSQGLTNEAIPTPALISMFLSNMSQDWRFRVRAAQILEARRESDVPPILLNSMTEDPNLWVRTASLHSFQTLTGFQPNDAFGFQEATEWWGKNKATYLNSLPKK